MIRQSLSFDEVRRSKLLSYSKSHDYGSCFFSMLSFDSCLSISLLFFGVALHEADRHGFFLLVVLRDKAVSSHRASSSSFPFVSLMLYVTFKLLLHLILILLYFRIIGFSLFFLCS